MLRKLPSFIEATLGLNQTDEAIARIIMRDGESNVRSLCRELSLHQTYVNKVLTAMWSEGLLYQRVGDFKKRFYSIREPLLEALIANDPVLVA